MKVSPIFRILAAAITVSAVLALDRTLVIGLIATAAFILYGMKLARFEITHPAVWLPPFIYVYHYNVIILHLMQYEHVEHPYMILWIGWLSIVTAVVIFITRCRPDQGEAKPGAPVNLSLMIIRFGYLAAFAMMVIVCRKYFGAGFTDKTQFITAATMPELKYVPLWLSLFYALWFIKHITSVAKIPWGLMAVTGGFTLFCTLALGERDIFLCFCAVSLFLVFYFRRPRRAVLIGLGVVIAGPVLTILHFMRNIFSSDLSSLSKFSDQGMMLSFLYGEFIAGGRNLDIILSNQQWWHFFHGATPLWVLQHKLFPGILVETRNSSMWFHQSFLPDWVTVVGGYGFTFSGDGYINFGLFGVVLWYAILSLLIVWLYNRHRGNGIFLAVYVASAPLLVWAMRATILYLPGAAMLILKPLLVAFLADAAIRGWRRHTQGLTHPQLARFSS